MRQGWQQFLRIGHSHCSRAVAHYIGAFSCGGMVIVCMSVYLYGDKAKTAVERDEPTWQKWMGERFPIPQGG